jgi:MtN3 and saliva related transmembrane protein
MFTLIGFAAGTLTTLAFLPQVFHTYRSKSAAGLSYTTLITFSVGVLLWFIYGLYLSSWPMILANGVTLVLQIPLLYMKLRYGRRGQA